MVPLDGSPDCLILVALEAQDLRDIPVLTFVHEGCEILQYRLEWVMLNQAHRVFTHDDFHLTRHSRSEQILNQFTDIATIAETD